MEVCGGKEKESRFMMRSPPILKVGIAAWCGELRTSVLFISYFRETEV